MNDQWMTAPSVFHFGAVNVSWLLRTEEALSLVRSSSIQRRMSLLLPASKPGLAPPVPHPGGMALLSVCCQGKKNTSRSPPLSPEWRPQGGRGMGVSLCLLSSVAWEAQKRKVCLSGSGLAVPGLWETGVWWAGSVPAVSGPDNELQVLLWVV